LMTGNLRTIVSVTLYEWRRKRFSSLMLITI